jgi:1-deoxy-D-xylulose-5-phosphate reductoisomerase
VKNLSILGSTGSIGRNTLEVVSNNPDRFRVLALAARNNIELLEKQITIFKPEVVAVYDDNAADELRRKGLPIEILTGQEGMIAAATYDKSDMVVSSIAGSPGLVPTFEAIKAGKDIALATKEALVMAGKIVMAEASRQGVKILPVDSEHSAVFQCLRGRSMDEVRKVILTASGGPFRKRKPTDLCS